MDPELVPRLAGPEGRALFERIGRYAEDSALAVSTRLRAEGHDPALVSAALAQARLRARAQAKLGPLADLLLLTGDGLEQATRPQLAADHAHRFRWAGGDGSGAVGPIEQVFDLGCGVGLDALHLLVAGLAVHAVDADRGTAEIARVNLAAVARAQGIEPGRAEVACRPAEQVRLPQGAATRHTGVWVDPARRTSGIADAQGRTRRLWRLADLSPSWAQVQHWAGQVPATGCKLTPAFPHAALPAGCEAQWSSWRGEVLECAVWWGPLVRTPGRTARVAPTTAGASTVTEADAADPPPPVGSLAGVGPWLYEADRAVVRAGLTGALARAVEGGELAGGYVGSAREVVVPWARRWRVVEAMPLRVKPIRAWLRQRGIGSVTVKKRGSSADAVRLAADLRGTGPGAATVVVTTVGGTGAAVVVEPG